MIDNLCNKILSLSSQVNLCFVCHAVASRECSIPCCERGNREGNVHIEENRKSKWEVDAPWKTYCGRHASNGEGENKGPSDAGNEEDDFAVVVYLVS